MGFRNLKIEDAWSGIAREPDADFLAVDGETAAAIRDIDWSTSPLGRPAGWPAALKTVLRIVLGFAPDDVLLVG